MSITPLEATPKPLFFNFIQPVIKIRRTRELAMWTVGFMKSAQGKSKQALCSVAVKPSLGN
jgi:hypothetical protein